MFECQDYYGTSLVPESQEARNKWGPQTGNPKNIVGYWNKRTLVGRFLLYSYNILGLVWASR